MKYNLKIRGAIGGWWGTDLEYVIDYLDKNKEKPLDVMICSPGGSVADGLEVYQAFRDHGNIHAHIVGMTASIATVIAMGAKQVTMVKDSVMLSIQQLNNKGSRSSCLPESQRCLPVYLGQQQDPKGSREHSLHSRRMAGSVRRSWRRSLQLYLHR